MGEAARVEALAREWYTALGPVPAWENLGDVTKSVWRAYAKHGRRLTVAELREHFKPKEVAPLKGWASKLIGGS